MDIYMKTALRVFLLPKGSCTVRRRIDAKNTVLLNYESHAAMLSSQTHKREVGEMEREWGGEAVRERQRFFTPFIRVSWNVGWHPNLEANRNDVICNCYPFSISIRLWLKHGQLWSDSHMIYTLKGGGWMRERGMQRCTNTTEIEWER